jgi:hypothetical protein
VPHDSVKAVLKRVRELVAAHPNSTQDLRDRLLAFEAAVLFRLGESRRANELFDLFRSRNPRQAELLVKRRMLRGFPKASKTEA